MGLCSWTAVSGYPVIGRPAYYCREAGFAVIPYRTDNLLYRATFTAMHEETAIQGTGGNQASEARPATGSAAAKARGSISMFNRRTVLTKAASLAVGLTFSPIAQSLGQAVAEVVLRRDGTPPVVLPSDFMGLGYEMSSISMAGLLSASNDCYVQLVRQLGTKGVIRAGGIVADFTRYEPNGAARSDKHDTIITPETLQQFNAFLKRVNWTTIWSVNFAQGTINDAVKEAQAVNKILGSSLQYFEIGNEVENYGRGNAFRKAPYTYSQYRAEYDEWRSAILRSVPGARFAAPDTADNVEWVEKMAEDAAGDVQLLTTHYYRNAQQQGSEVQLIYPDPKLLSKLQRLRIAAKRSEVPWRMCETNSFSGGGRPGVSDTLLGALWTLDFMAVLAEYGCAGVNIETGINQLGFVSSYSPIQDDGNNHNRAGAPYYGMLAYSKACEGCSQVLSLALPGEQPSVTAYAFGNRNAAEAAVLINRGATNQTFSLIEFNLRNANVMRLNGSATDKAEVLLGGSKVDKTGRWSNVVNERVRDSAVIVPAMSAAIVRRA